MSFFKSLPFKLLLGIIIGSIIGIYSYDILKEVVVKVSTNVDAGYFLQTGEKIFESKSSLALLNEATRLQVLIWGALQVIVCVHRLLGQFISFCIPLIVLGFICPSITKMGQNAGKLLGIALIIAYLSSILASSMSAIAGYILVPVLGIHPTNAFEREIPAAIFTLDIPQIMPVITALVLSIAIGLSSVKTKSKNTILLLKEFQEIVIDIVNKIIIPILPFYIGTTFVTLGYNGTLEQFPVFIKAILIVMVGHFVWMAILYIIAGVYSGKNPFEVIKHYGPAYITAVGTMSSAATLSVALECANKSKVLRKDLVGFGIPLFANIHLCGSVLTETFFCFIIHYFMFNSLPSFSTMILFIILFGIFAVGAPGVPGGTVIASLGIVQSVMCAAAGATSIQTELFTGTLLAIFALQDSFGTACNVTGDGALTLFLTGYAEKHGIKKAR